MKGYMATIVLNILDSQKTKNGQMLCLRSVDNFETGRDHENGALGFFSFVRYFCYYGLGTKIQLTSRKHFHNLGELHKGYNYDG